MESRRVTVSKSSPMVLTASVIKKNEFLTEATKKVLDSTNRDFKRNIVSNPEKGTETQRKPYLIFEDGLNFTPRPLYDPSFPGVSVKMLPALSGVKPPAASLRPASKIGSHSNSSMHSFISTVPSRFSVNRLSKGSVASSVFSSRLTATEELTMAIKEGSEDEKEYEFVSQDRPPSMFRLREDPPPKKPNLETSFTITLKESDLLFFLQKPTGAICIDTEEWEEVMTSNKMYERSLACKTRSNTATQTTRVFQKHRKQYLLRNERANANTFASVWDIYDTYKEETRRDSTKSSQVREEGLVEFIEEPGETEKYIEEFEYEGSTFNVSLLTALMVMERIVQRNSYGKKQLEFQGLLVENPLSLDVKYSYTLHHLWTFQNEKIKGRRVTSMCWSARVHNVLAVGYGKFKYTDKVTGLVCVWNVKNPHDPERIYQFENPVTFVVFSEIRTQILAVSFYTGHVLLIDIISRSVMIKASNHNYPLYYPVWQMRWFPNYNSTGHCLVTCGKNGSVYRYRKTKFFISKRIMSVERPHGNIQGVYQPKKCFARKTLSSRNPSAEVLIRHPTDPLIYLIGTSEGYVYVCSVNHRRDHLEVFVAHNGPVYTIQFNPFCDKVFLTCGADWCIRIWAEGIYEPILTLESGMSSIQAALWNPLHSTIIVSITGTLIEVWDIRRKVSTPKSSTESPTKSFNTVLHFTENKYNVCVGDADGHVHVLALTEMPFSPSFQEDALAQSIMNALISRPEVIEKLCRLGKPFASEESSYKSKMYKKLNKLQKII